MVAANRRPIWEDLLPQPDGTPEQEERDELDVGRDPSSVVTLERVEIWGDRVVENDGFEDEVDEGGEDGEEEEGQKRFRERERVDGDTEEPGESELREEDGGEEEEKTRARKGSHLDRRRWKEWREEGRKSDSP